MGRADNENLGVAFALVAGAGAATGLGAAVVFVPALVRLASRKTLASSLGLSAGVMTYVSFVEIFGKSLIAFENAGHDADDAYIYASLCFFAGVIFMLILNHTVKWLLGGHHHHPHHHHGDGHFHRGDTGRLSSDAHVSGDQNNNNNIDPPRAQEDEAKETETENMNKRALMEPVCACCADDPAGDLQNLQDMAEEIENYKHANQIDWEGAPRTTEASRPNQADESGSEDNRQQDDHAGSERGAVQDQAEHKKLMRMSLNTALAIGLHNFPEGLATFVAALNDPSVGAVLAVAIAIHNIPEGLCVAMPIYYATGDKFKAFGWAILSGVAEPIAAVLGWAVLASSFSDQSYGIVFGLVAGMMVIISIRELLPTAHRYDPEDSVVTYSFVVGMAVMAVSLILFKL